MQSINLKRVALVIGHLVDQICDEDLRHSSRVAVMAWRIGRRMQLPQADLDDLMIAALIHDCGVASPKEYMTTVTQLRWGDEDEHCRRGAEYVGNCTLLKAYKNIVRYHHTPWNKLENEPIPEREKILANILFCVDRSYVGFHDLSQKVGYNNVINFKPEMCLPLTNLEDRSVAGDIMGAFQDVARTDGFWLALYPDFLDSTLSPLNQQNGVDHEITPGQMRNIGTLISRLVDVKSHFTQEHSERVSLISTTLAERLGLDDTTVKELEIAALLHDVGKQQAPESILLKPGSLDESERAIIKRHTIGTEVILNMLFSDCHLVEWASNHHEKLDGSGYPYGLVSTELDTCSRILTMSDIFQALTQDRPYRERMSPDGALGLVGAMVDKGELDAEVFQVLKSGLSFFYELSIA